jgi:hypothetical protein
MFSGMDSGSQMEIVKAVEYWSDVTTFQLLSISGSHDFESPICAQ